MFDHIPKKSHTSTASKLATSAPPINIYLSPLRNITCQHINVTGSPSRKNIIHKSDTTPTKGKLIHYPLVANVLCELHEVMPLLNYLQYEDTFTKNGVVYTNAVLDLDIFSFVDIIGMPRATIHPFIDHVNVVVRKARKGKGKAVSLKEEDEEVTVISDEPDIKSYYFRYLVSLVLQYSTLVHVFLQGSILISIHCVQTILLPFQLSLR